MPSEQLPDATPILPKILQIRSGKSGSKAQMQLKMLQVIISAIVSCFMSLSLYRTTRPKPALATIAITIRTKWFNISNQRSCRSQHLE